jgi:large repetitive protein
VCASVVAVSLEELVSRVPSCARSAALAALGLVLALTGALSVTAGPAAAAAAAPTDLRSCLGTVDGNRGCTGVDGERSPVLSWARVPGATSYRVQGSASSDFSSLLFNQPTTNNTYAPTRVLNQGPLYWRVQATDASGTSGFVAADQSVQISALPVPGGLAIQASAGAEVTPPVAPPVISWAAVPGATGYDIELDDNNDGVGTVKTGIKTTSYVWPDPQGVVKDGYGVRVRARFDNSLLSAWTDGWVKYSVTQLAPVTSTATTCPAELTCVLAPEKTNPSVPRPITEVEDVVFAWDPVPGAQKYEIWISRVSDFSDTPVEMRTVSGTRYSPKTTYQNGPYFWQVRPVNALGEGTPWPMVPSEFRRRWQVAPQLVHPASSRTDTVTGDLYFQWEPVQHATRYQLEIGTDPNFTPNTYSTCTTAQTTFTYGQRTDSCGTLRLSQGSVYYWRVRAFDAPTNVPSLYSATWEVVYDLGDVDETAPANGTTVSVPTLRWSTTAGTRTEASSVKGAQRYRVEVKDATGKVVDSRDTYALSYTPTVALDPAQSKNPYSWTVVALDGSGKPSPLYAPSTFYYEKPTSGSQPMKANQTVYGDTQSRFPSLSWQPMDGASYYKLNVFNSAGFLLNEKTTTVLDTELHHPAVTDWDSFFLTSPATYTFGVTAYDSSNRPLGSTPENDRGTFSVRQLPAVSGMRLGTDGTAIDSRETCDLRWTSTKPLDNICSGVTSTPTFDWDPVPGAGGYMVYLYFESDVTTPVYTPTITSTESTRWTPDTSVKQALADNTTETGAYYWFVRPCVTIRPFLNCGPDPASSLDAATNAFRKLSPAVEPLRPTTATGTGPSSQVTFSWKDYRETSAGSGLTSEQGTTPFPRGTHPSHQSAMTYRVQVSANQVMTDGNAIDDQTVDQTTYTAFTSLYPDGDLYWRVQAIDGASNRLQWSQPVKFSKSSPKPDLASASPEANTALGSGDVRFRWNANDFDSTWSIEVYKNNDQTGSTANLVRTASGSTKQAAFVPSAALAPSSEPYVWRVRRTDAYGNVGPWSDFSTFRVDNTAVTGLGDAQPLPIVQPDAVSLGWKPWTADTRQAYSYAVDIRNAANQSVGSLSSTTSTRFFPTVNFDGGTYTWVVTAYDASGNAIGTSPTGAQAWRFVVDTVLEGSTPSILVPAEGAKVGQTLSSNGPTWNRPDVTETYQWLRDGATISGATGKTYTLANADVNKTISLRVTGKKSGYTEQRVISTGVVVEPGSAAAPSVLPSITGNAAVKETLTANPGQWPSGTTLTYQWFVNGEAVARETKSSYVVRARDAGLPVMVRVTGSRTGFLPGSADSAAVSVAKMASTTTAKAKKKKITQRDRPSLDISVGLVDFGATLGAVQVKEGTKVLASTPLSSGKDGKLELRLKKLKAGKHKLTVSYLGSPSTAASSSTVTIKVIRPKKGKQKAKK